MNWRNLQWSFLAAIFVGLCSQSVGLAQRINPAVVPETALAGEALAAARRQAIDDRPFQRPLDAERIRRWMEISSRTTMAEFELFLAPLDAQETRLLAKIDHQQAPIVNRLSLDNLRGVLANGGLLSLYEEQRMRHAGVRHVTPAVEDRLYGAYDCVFASVGPPHGSPRYGEVIIRLKDSVRENGWATPFSGMYFIYAIRHKDARGMRDLLSAGRELPITPGSRLKLGFDDRLHFSHYVVTEKHWNKALAYQAILVLRNLDKSPAGDKVRDRFAEMLTKDGPEFWSLFIPPRIQELPEADEQARVAFGYLEGKFPDRLSIKDFTAIEVPADKLAEVRGWPEAKPYLELLRAKGADTP